MKPKQKPKTFAGSIAQNLSRRSQLAALKKQIRQQTGKAQQQKSVQ
jgi:hypothetical protein